MPVRNSVGRSVSQSSVGRSVGLLVVRMSPQKYFNDCLLARQIIFELIWLCSLETSFFLFKLPASVESIFNSVSQSAVLDLIKRVYVFN